MGESIFKAYKAKSARDEENLLVKEKVWTKLNGGTSTKTEDIIDSGCTYHVTTKTVTDDMNVKIKRLAETPTIIEASVKKSESSRHGKDVLRSRGCERKKNVRSCRRRRIKGDTHFSGLKKWDLIHASFPK